MAWMDIGLNAEALTTGKLGGMKHWTGCKKTISRICHPHSQSGRWGSGFATWDFLVRGNAQSVTLFRGMFRGIVRIVEYRWRCRMSDLISRQDAIDQLHQSISHLDAEVRLRELPSAEPEIVMCEDCRHNGSFDTDCPIKWAGKEYCSFGEKKNES